jgi:dipeptidyl-peptidase-4
MATISTSPPLPTIQRSVTSTTSTSKTRKKNLNASARKTRLVPHSYQIAPGGKYAVHSFSNANTPPTTELVSLPDHKVIRTLVANQKLKKAISELKPTPVEFFQITTEDGVTMEGYQMFPAGL